MNFDDDRFYAIAEKIEVNKKPILPIDDLLFLSQNSFFNLYYSDHIYRFANVLYHVGEDLLNGLYDASFFENYSVNLPKIQLIILRFDRSITDYYELEPNMFMADDFILPEYGEFLSKEESDFNNAFAERMNLINAGKWFVNHLSNYCPDYEFQSKLGKGDLFEIGEGLKTDTANEEEDAREEEKDGRRTNQKAPTNQERIKALKYLAPELWEKLQKQQSKSLQQDVIHLITGVNKEDSYKYSFGDRQRQAEERDIPNLTDLVNKLTQS